MHIYVLSISLNCTTITLPCILALQRREYSRSTRKVRTWRHAQGPRHLPPGSSPCGWSSWLPWSPRKLWRDNPAPSRWESHRIRVNWQHPHSRCRIQPAEAEPPPHPDNFLDAAFYIKFKETIKVIFVSGWGVFIQQYQFNELDDRMSKLEKVQNVNNSAEETAVELDGEMSMEADLTGKFLMQQVAAVMAKKQNSTKRKLKTGEKWKG